MKSKKTRHRFRRVGALLLALVLCAGLVPSAFAIQDNAYHDPAEHWITALDRTDELDANAVVTQETFLLRCLCAMETILSNGVARTRRYTVDGVSCIMPRHTSSILTGR